MRCKAFRASFTLSAAGHIASGDTEGRGDFPLGQGDSSPQTVAQADDFRLPGGEALPNQLVEPQGVVPVVEVLQHGVIHTHHIDQLQGIALLVVFNGVRQRDLPLELLLAPEVHEDFIFNAPGGIGGKPGPLGGVKAGNALDEANGANGDQVLLVGALGVIFFGRVKQREGLVLLKAASHGPPNFRWMFKWISSLVLFFWTTILSRIVVTKAE